MIQEYDYEFAEFIYYSPRELDKESGLWPVRGGQSIAKPNYRVGPKRIECYSLHMVQEGKLRFAFQDKQLDIGKGDLFCLFPGFTYHYSIAEEGAPLRLSWVAIDGPRSMNLLELAGITPSTPYMRLGSTSLIEETMEGMRNSMRDAGNWKPAVSLKLQSLLFELFASLTHNTVAKAEGEPAGWIRECIEFMELHAAEGVTVQQAAAFAGVNRSYFSSVFTRQVGMSPMSYLQKIRMEKAKRLLRETDAAVTEIALSLGYPNLYSFTRAFKNYYCVPPVTFRSAANADL